MQSLVENATAHRIEMAELAREAKISGTILTRWRRGNPPKLPTIAKLEKALSDICARREAA